MQFWLFGFALLCGALYSFCMITSSTQTKSCYSKPFLCMLQYLFVFYFSYFFAFLIPLYFITSFHPAVLCLIYLVPQKSPFGTPFAIPNSSRVYLSWLAWFIFFMVPVSIPVFKPRIIDNPTFDLLSSISYCLNDTADGLI